AGAERSGSRRRGGFRLGAALAAAGAVAVVLLVVLALGGGDAGGPATPSVSDVASVALAGTSAPPPAAPPGGALLDAHAGPLASPPWTRAGLRPVGARSDTVRGHAVETVFYADAAGRRIGYAIADAELPVAGGRTVTRRGARLRVLDHGDAAVV